MSERRTHTVGDVPPAPDGDVVRRDKVANQREQRHHLVLGHRHGVAARDFHNVNAPLARGRQVDVVASNAGCDCELEAGRGCNSIRRQVRRPEGLADSHVRADQVARKLAVGAVLVGRHHKL